jgi:hypothetical protein
MDKEEAVLTLRKNKLDMEHQELLQDRNIIVITEAGFPLTLINIIITAQLYMSSIIASIILASLLFMGVIEWFRRRNKAEIINKRNEIDVFIRQLKSEKR